MKKHKRSVIAAALAMLILSACGNGNVENLSRISAASLETHIENTEQYSESVSAKTASAKQSEQTKQTEKTGKSNILIAYFS